MEVWLSSVLPGAAAVGTAGRNAEGREMNASSPRERATVVYRQSPGAELDLLDPDGQLSAAALQLPTFTTAAKVRVFVTFILCGVSTLCNLAVLWAASGQKRKSHVRVLIVNLTVADLLVTFIVMPVDAAWNITVEWVASDLACRILMFLKLQAMYSCAFVTVVISLDRQFAILNPLAVVTARRRNKAMLTAAWATSAVLSVPQVEDAALVADARYQDAVRVETEGRLWPSGVQATRSRSLANSWAELQSSNILNWKVLSLFPSFNLKVALAPAAHNPRRFEEDAAGRVGNERVEAAARRNVVATGALAL